MRINVGTYIPKNSLVHAADARVKLVLLLAYSLTLFLIKTGAGLFLCILLFAVAAALSRVPVRKFFLPIVPVYVIVVFTILFNSFSFDVIQASDINRLSGFGNISVGIAQTWQPIMLIGSFGFVPQGFVRGCFFATRIVLLVVASLAVTYTTTSTELVNALSDFLRPLRRFHVPADDIAMVLSLALRFIPVTAEEFSRVYDAQISRGAAFGSGTLWKRLRAWQTVLIPLFVGLFRRADALAIAMDTRCYGTADIKRTSLNTIPLRSSHIVVLVVILCVCVIMAVFL